MNTTLAQPIGVPRSGTSGRVLIVEPDGHRAGLLGRILSPLTSIELRIVPQVADAIRILTEAIPDLVMTWPLLPPAEETKLWAHIRRTPGAAHVQVISLPYSIEGARSAASDPSRSSVFPFLRRSQWKNREACDAATLREEIAQYLAQAVARRDEAQLRLPDPALEVDSSALVLYGAKDLVDRGDRRRATRRTANDLADSWTIRLPWGSDGKLVDISNTGVLFESSSKISPGITIDLQILGKQRNVFVPALMVRTEMSRVDTSGARYQMAAAFGRDVRLVDFDAAVGLASPRVLTDLLARVLSDSEGPATAIDVSQRFESELRRLLPRRDIRIRTTPVRTPSGAESIYVTLEPRAGSPRILQVTFDSGNAPSEMEFKLLKTAANMVAVAFEIAELSRPAR